MLREKKVAERQIQYTILSKFCFNNSKCIRHGMEFLEHQDSICGEERRRMGLGSRGIQLYL